jgi:hypothetical protein
MKNPKRIDFFLIFQIITVWIPTSLIVMTIGLLYYVKFAIYFNDKVLAEKSTSMVCKIKEYQKIHKKLPSELSEIVYGSGWWDKLGYTNINGHDFDLTISNGFDSTSIYSSTDNKWDLPDPPFPFQKELIKVDCTSISNP